MHYVWQKHQQHQHCQDVTYCQYIDKIKLTPRIWNSKEKITRIFQHLTWTLNLNINIIGFKKLKRSYFECSQHTSTCFFPYYVFQNTLVKLLRKQNAVNDINILVYKTKYYVMSQNDLKPFLINIPPSTPNNLPIIELTKDKILNIIQNKPVQLPFNIQLYSTYYYINCKFIKSIQKNLIGYYQNDTNITTFQLFLSPQLNFNQPFYLHILENINCPSFPTHLNNYFTNLPIKEGEKPYISKEQSSLELLNQDHCICAHPETKRIFIPSPQSFKPLASKYSQKYYLYENLEAFGLLNNDLLNNLKLCGELSILSFDTESLNKSLLPEDIIGNNIDGDFVNNFQKNFTEKKTYAVQQLYTIGKTIFSIHL